MSSKKKTKYGKPEKSKASPKADQPKQQFDNGEEKPMDFGGITNRDLKKNLGCG